MFEDNPELLIGAITVVLGVISIFHGLFGAWLQRRLARRERAVRLYEDFYSADSYRRIVVPVFRLMLKWEGLQDDARATYRTTVARGWIGADGSAEKLLALYVSPENLARDPDDAHFRATLTTEAFTEHEALTVFLYRWMTVDVMLRAGVIDAGVTRRLFSGAFAYYHGFLKALSQELDTHLTVDQHPAWMPAVERLEKHLC